MLKFLRLTAAPFFALLVLMAGCSTEQTQATSQTPTSSVPTEPAPSPIPSAAPSPQTNLFQDASDKAISAETISESAQSQNDWDLVAGMWQEAITSMKAVPPSSLSYALAQKKVEEYQQNLAYAKQQSVKPATSPEFTLVEENTKSPVYQIKGNLKLVDSDIAGSDKYCYGTGGYEDIQGEMSVTIKDGEGNIIATGQTGDGTRPSGEYSSVQCVFEFQVDNVPKSDFYSIEVGRRGQVNVSYEEIKNNNWEVSLSLK